MIKITVINKELLDHARLVMNIELLHNPNINGADYSVEIGEYNEVECGDVLTEISLFNIIFCDDDEPHQEDDDDNE